MSNAYDTLGYRSASSKIRIHRDTRVHVGSVGFGEYPSISKPDEFTEFESYNLPDWDGSGANPITSATVYAARNFYRLIPDIRRPDIVPSGTGTIGFEWRFGSPANRKFVLVDVGPGDLITGRIVHADGKIERFPPTKLGTGVIKLIISLFY
jgi:hypothetical protein